MTSQLSGFILLTFSIGNLCAVFAEAQVPFKVQKSAADGVLISSIVDHYQHSQSLTAGIRERALSFEIYQKQLAELGYREVQGYFHIKSETDLYQFKVEHNLIFEKFSPALKDQYVKILNQTLRNYAVELLSKLGRRSKNLAIALNTKSTSLFQLNESFPLEGEFDRSSRTLGMLGLTILPGKWLISFVHEAFHSLDNLLEKATEESFNPKATALVSAITEKNYTPKSPNEARILQDWTLSALNKELLAEYRAWTGTFAIYLEWKNSSKTKFLDEISLESSMMENLLVESKISSLYSLKDRVFDFFDGQFFDPAVVSEWQPTAKSTGTGMNEKDLCSPSPKPTFFCKEIGARILRELREQVRLNRAFRPLGSEIGKIIYENEL